MNAPLGGVVMRILDLNSTLSADYWAAIRLHSLCIPHGGVGWGAEDGIERSSTRICDSYIYCLQPTPHI